MMRKKTEFGWFASPDSRIPALSDEERDNIMARADLRRLSYGFRVDLASLPQQPENNPDKKKKREAEFSLIKNEAAGQVLLSPKEAGNILQNKEEIMAKAGEIADVAPLFSQLSYATIAKAEQAAGDDYSEALRLAKDAKAKSKSALPNKASDFMPDAVLFGIFQRRLNGQELPDIAALAEAAAGDKKILQASALALPEDRREEFLNCLPEELRHRTGIIWDAALSDVLQDKHLLEIEKEGRNKVRIRTASALKSSLAAEEERGGMEIIGNLTETLSNLGDEESLILLQELVQESIGGTNWEKNKVKLLKAARQLALMDGFTGNGLMMKILGHDELGTRQFDYLLGKMHQEGFLAKNLDLAAGWPDERCEKLFSFLKKNETEWQDEANVLTPFQNGVKVFGWQKMFKYAGRSDVSRHDALFAFDKIMDLHRQSGLAPEKFFGDVLNQIYNDGSAYEEGNSYHHFNDIVNSLDLSDVRLAEIKANAGRFKIKELRQLTENYDSKGKILASWHDLKNYVGLLWILEQGEILEELSELEEAGKKDIRKEKLAKFIKILAFHRDSKVDKASLIEFWREPEKFLARMDGHTPENIQNARKPSNYLEINHLDLSGDELRDALISGGLDWIQAFPKMEAIYEVSLSNNDLRQTSGFIGSIKRELGSFKNDTANKPLFNELRIILRESGIKMADFLDKADENEIFSGLSAVESEEIRKRASLAMEKFPNAKIDRTQTPVRKRYRGKVNLKSDPQAILAGNDTACCMPFGSGKNNIYMFNPNCGLFTLEEEKGNGEWRTIAQSVLTLDIDAGRKVPEIIGSIQKPGRISDVFPPQILEQTEHFLACDNIEVAGNSKGKENIIKSVYARFFKSYLAYYNERQPAVIINPDKIIIGQANSDVKFGQSEDNTFVPAAPVGYSDKLGSKIDVLHFTDKDKNRVKIVEQSVDMERGEHARRKAGKGVSALTFRDSLAVALLEDKVYGDNQSLMYHLDKMENTLIAKDINNSVKERPNLSLKFNDAAGRLRGYLLAYEGRGDNGEPLIYISDLASDRQSKVAGGSLIFSFLDQYKEDYLDQNNSVPVVIEAREGTSYELIMNNINKISERIGRKIKVREMAAYQAGSDKMHRLLITV